MECKVGQLVRVNNCTSNGKPYNGKLAHIVRASGSGEPGDWYIRIIDSGKEISLGSHRLFPPAA